MVGYNAGENAQGSNNIFIGFEAGQDENADNKLYIENSNADSTGALIYGDFDDDLLMFNGKVIVRDGITDTDMDTKIELEQSPDDDQIRFQIQGQSAYNMARNSFGSTRLSVNNDFSSVFIGSNAGEDNGDGASNIVDSKFNTGIGNNAMQLNTTGYGNTSLGYFSLRENTATNFNTAIGEGALTSLNSGGSNTAIGKSALNETTSSTGSVGIGFNALGGNINGTQSVAIGYRTGVFDIKSDRNVFVGYNAGIGGNTTADNHGKADNVMMGYESGYNAKGDANIFLGYKSGYFETNDERLYIENSDAGPSDALIYGEFDNDLLRVNGSLNINEEYTFPTVDGLSGRVLTTNGAGILSWQIDDDGPWNVNGSNEPYFTSAFVGVGTTNPNTRLHAVHNANGEFVARLDNTNTGTKAYGLEIELGPTSNPETTNIYVGFSDGNGTQIGAITEDGSGGIDYATTSDRRLKQNIKYYNKGIDLISKIDAYSYEMKSNPGIKHIGFIAQELYKVAPSMVKGTPTTTDIDNPMMVDYSKMTPILLAAIKELIEENNQLKKKVENLEANTAQANDLKVQLDAQLDMIKELSKSIGVKVE